MRSLYLGAMLLALASPHLLVGQEVRGSVQAEDGGSLEGVLVLAIDSVGTVRARWITGPDGSRDYRTADGSEVLLQSSEDTVFATGTVPMQSAAPEYLAREGFIVPGPDTTYYYAPDANVLLSDAFLSTHCFEVSSRGGEAWVGLRFEPMDPERLDIRGVFWLPIGGDQFPYIEFEWTNHPWDLMEVFDHGRVAPARLGSRVGGRVDLSFVAEIGWIVHRWSMRWPVPVELKYETSDLEPGWYLGLFREWEATLLHVEVVGSGSGEGGGKPGDASLPLGP